MAKDRDFRLEHIRGTGSHRRRIERNLGSTLKHLDLGNPRDSELLKVGLGVHSGQTVFNGSAGAKQFELIREWAIQAATELRPADLTLATSPNGTGRTAGSDWGDLSSNARRRTPRLPVNEAPKFDLTGEPAVSLADLTSVTSPAGIPTPGTTETADRLPRRPEPPADDEDLSSFQKLLRETSPTKDAFDPERFNRQYTR